MTCQDYMDRMLAGLSEGEAAGELSGHEASCGLCQRRGASMRAALDGIAALPASPPAGFAKGAWQRVASAHAPWEQTSPTLLDRLAMWLSLPRLLPLAAGAAAVVLLASNFMSVRPGPAPVEKVDEVAFRVLKSSAGVEVASSVHGASVSVPEGGHATLELGPATTVTVAGPASARATRGGLLELDHGSIWVDVRHDLLGPAGFRVETPHLGLRVTGTQFNVRTVLGETAAELITGKIELKHGSQTRVMLPGERVRATAQRLELVTKASGPLWPLPPAQAREGSSSAQVDRPSAPMSTPEARPAAKPAERIEVR
jgi:hypothetical protein